MTHHIGIVILPDKSTNLLLRGLAKNVPGNRLDLEVDPPHLSLLHVMLDDEGVRHAQSLVAELKAAPVPLPCYQTTAERTGWNFLEVRASPQLLALQVEVLPLSKCRQGSTPFLQRDWATVAQENAYQDYGYPNVGAAWQPRFAFGIGHKSVKRSTLPMQRLATGQTMAVARLSQHGAVETLLFSRAL